MRSVAVTFIVFEARSIRLSFALHRRFPGTRALPLARIAELPTPVERLDIAEKIGEMWVQRDDLTSTAYGGNKIRKLDLLLGDALDQGCRAVITFGAYGSNHALATAVHATALGLEVHAVLSPQAPGPFAPRTLLAHAGLGTHIHPAASWDGRPEADAARREILERGVGEVYEIPMGGTSPLGAVGYVNAALEVAERAAGDGKSPGSAPDVIYVAGGTLGTAAGLAVGLAAAGLATRVEAVRVTPAEVACESALGALVGDISSLLHGADTSFPLLGLGDVRLNLRHEFFEPGYGVVTDATLEAVRIAADAGLSLETTYTGKAFSAMLTDARTGLLGDKRVLFIDTYNSAPYPEPGRIEALSPELQEYVQECWRRYPEATA